MSARSLANDQSAIIAMVTYITPRTTGSTVSDPFMSSVAASVEQRTREAGYYLMLRSAESVAALEGLIHSWRLSGLIMTGLFQDSFFDAVAKLGIPSSSSTAMWTTRTSAASAWRMKKGGYLATKHLLENGHRVIAFASPPISPAGVIELRLQGYRRALAEYGVPYDPALVFTQEISVQEGKKLGHQLSTHPEITGIFASADILAAGIMSGLHECGVSVPRDKSIVGFDDHYISQLAIPGLTTIHQDSEKKGTLATEMILAQLRKEEIAQKKVILPVHLVERGSVRNIKE